MKNEKLDKEIKETIKIMYKSKNLWEIYQKTRLLYHLLNLRLKDK